MTSFWAKQRVLVVAPHADDEVYGCGGTIAKVKALGGEVYVIVGSVGDLYHYGSHPAAVAEEARAVELPAALDLVNVDSHNNLFTDAHPRLRLDVKPRQDLIPPANDLQHYGPNLAVVTGETRAAELRAAMVLLNVDGHEILFTDAHSHLRLDAKPRRDLIALLERDATYAIDKIHPTILVLPAPSYNQDHEALLKAGFAACRPHRREDKPFVSLVLVCDAPQLGWRHSAFCPNFYVDISEYLGTKLDALACHSSQLRPAPDPGSLANVERLARFRGADVGVDAAEAFECHRIVL